MKLKTFPAIGCEEGSLHGSQHKGYVANSSFTDKMGISVTLKLVILTPR